MSLVACFYQQVNKIFSRITISMGCGASKVDKEERVQKCKERKKLMKQLLYSRRDFYSAILAYLRALKNTGITLRQFTESELLELENVPFSSGLPPSPPPPLPPAPPPPPPYIPDSKKAEGNQNAKETQEEIIGEESGCTPPPPIPSTSWDLLDLFDNSSVQHEEERSVVDEEKWADTRSQFEDEDREHIITSHKPPGVLAVNQVNTDIVDDDSSTISGQTKDTVDMAVVVWKSKKTLPGIARELDDCFLKAFAGGKEIAILGDNGTRNTSQHHEYRDTKGKGTNSTRTLSSFSWGWSSRSLPLTRSVAEPGSSVEPCKPGAHCITLEKLYDEEQFLYKAVREVELKKWEHERKSLSLQKREKENMDSSKIEKTRATVENLKSDIVRLQELIRKSDSSILSLISEELHPQLIALLSGLAHMWKTMYECHQVQSRISRHVNHLANHHSTDPTTEYHREAAVQLENEVKFWYTSFCRLAKCQRQYVTFLCQWIKDTDCLVDNENQSHGPSTVHALCQKWQAALDKLPEKAASEAINTFLLSIRSIIQQQEVEGILKKKSDKLKRRWDKEIELEKKLRESVGLDDTETGLSPKHPLSVKRAKIDVLKKRYDLEKAKYVNSVQVTRDMTLKSLQRCLPDIFQALMVYSSACTQAFELALNDVEQVPDVVESPDEEPV